MGLLDRFKKGKTNKEETKIEIEKNKDTVLEPNIITDGVNEKYLFYADKIIFLLVNLLRKLNAVEEKTFALKEYSGNEYALLKEEYGRIANELCTKELLERGYLRAFGEPTKYGHINKGCDLEFVMKSTNIATVIMYNDRSKSYLYTYRFSFKNINGTWKLSSVSCRLGDDDSWHVDNI